MRKLQLKVETLRALSQCEGIPLLEDTLRMQLRLLINPTPLLSEMREALNEMESQRLIVGVRDTLADLIKWQITDAGRAKLAELIP